MRVDVCIASSHGGHLELVRVLAPAWEGRRHLVVTPRSRQAEALRRDGWPVAFVANPRRNPARLVLNTAQSAGIAAAVRPRVVLTPGAGVAAPLSLAAKALGAQLVFVETMARVDRGSATGRALYRFADHFLVQWPEMRGAFPRAEVCRPALLEDVGTPPERGNGTVVATGTHAQQFDRLLRLADEAAAAGALPGPVLAQTGASRYRPRHMDAVKSLPPAEMERAIGESEVVMCHAGSGLVSLAIRSGRTPLVLARRREHGEHVNDHQVEAAARLARTGLAVQLDQSSIEHAVAAGRRRPERLDGEVEGPALVDRLRELIEATA